MNSRTSHRMLLTMLVAGIWAGVLTGQSQLSDDTIGTASRTNLHRLQFGLNALGAGIEYRYRLLSFVSADAVVSGLRPGAALGVTLSPISFLFVQGVLGKGSWEELPAPDGPAPFKPDYLYGWKAGLQIPIAPRKSTMYVQFGAGQLKYVQGRYLYNSGGFILEPPPAPNYRRETRVAEVFALSLGFCF